MTRVNPEAGTALQLVNLVGEALRTINDLLSSGKGKHNLVVGKPGAGDILLHAEQRCKGYRFGWVSHVYQYKGDTTITAVVAEDNRNNNTGGNPEIISGGVGHKSVLVKVTSRIFRGFDHTVHVYGKKDYCHEDSNMAQVIPVADTALQLAKLAGEAVRTINNLPSSRNGQHNLVVGKLEAGDILLHAEQKCEDYEGGCVSYVGDNTITAVVAKDNLNDDTGGDPKIISGGPGCRHVRVEVTSRLGRGFNHTVYVYGKKTKRNFTLL